MEKEKLTKIVKAVQRGSEAAVTDLYNLYHNDIYYYILRTLDKQNDPELAADLTQDTFIEILQTIDKLQDPSAFTTWSRKIAYHRCTAYFRKRHELLADENEDGTTIFDTLVEEREAFIPGEALDKEDLKNIIQEMIDSLPAEQRSAIMMRYFDELSVQQIADIQRTTEGTVKSRLNYGRKAIKRAVEDYEKKHDVKLHCAGIVPLLLWLFRAQKSAKAAGKLSSLGVVSKTGKAKAVSAAKRTAKFTARKAISLALAGAIAIGALGVGVSLLTKKDQPAANDPLSTPVQEDPFSTAQEAAIAPEDFFGTWSNGGDTITISFDETAQQYCFEYSPVGDPSFVFYAGFDAAESTFWVAEGHACGYEELDAQGNPTLVWKGTDNPALRFTYQDDLLYWYIGENEPQILFRVDAADNFDNAPTADNSDEGVTSAQFALENYPAYAQKVEEYCTAIFSNEYSEESYPTLNTLMLNYYHRFNEDAWFFYALEDIDSNGTPELLIGKTFSPEGIPDIIDLYSLSGNAIVQYFEYPYFGERTSLSILEGGLLENSGSSSAASGGCAIYQISADGSSISKIADYTYYFADDNVPPPEGEYMSYEEFEAATAQYQPYPKQIQWLPIDF